ncbi:MAG: cell division protein FtsA [Chthoniobacterales bacterium]
MVGLDIGTAKICIAVGERWRDGRINLLGVSQAPAGGVREGDILDREAVVNCLREALADAETQSDVMIRSVSVGVAGAQIQSLNIPEVVFSREDHDSLAAEAIRVRNVSFPAGNDLLHCLEKRYQTGNRLRVLDRIGSPRPEVKADFHIIYGERPLLLQTVRCVKELPLEVEHVVFTPLASAEVVLTQDQKNRDALVIDLGAGTTGYVLYKAGAPTHSGMLAIGGDHITNDLSMGLRIPMTLAEELKVKEGSVTLGKYPPEETVSLGIGDGSEARQIKRELLNTIIHERVRGTLEALKKRLTDGNFTNRTGGCIFLTGGCSHLPGVCALAEEIFGIPARLARVTEMVSGREDDLKNPQYSCAIGLLKFWKS